MEDEAALAATSSSVGESLELTSPAARTVALMVFRAESQQVFPGTGGTADQRFISFQLHGTILIMVPDLKQSPKCMTTKSMHTIFSPELLFGASQIEVFGIRDWR